MDFSLHTHQSWQTKTFHSYDNKESVTAKAQYVVDNELRGALTWLVENDLPADHPESLLGIVGDILNLYCALDINKACAKNLL